MKPTTIIETKGSIVYIDDDLSEYMRLPKQEKPREKAEWSDERAGVLQDAVWHPMISWWIDDYIGHRNLLSHGWCNDCPGLHIEYAGDEQEGIAWFPRASIIQQQ